MKIYVLFGGSSFSDKDLGARYNLIIKILKTLGASVDFEFAGETDAASSEISKAKMEKADAVIGEVSRAGIALGYKISEALSAKKQILCLFLKSKKPKELAVFEGPIFKHLLVKEYGEENLKEILSEFLNSLKKKKGRAMTKRFNFFLPVEMEEFLDWYHSEKKIARSDLVRDLIKEKMGKEKQFRLYSKGKK